MKSRAESNSQRQDLLLLSLRFWHQSFVQAKNLSSYTRYNLKHGNPAGGYDVIGYAKKLQALIHNLDKASNFDKEQQLIGIFDKWKSSYIHHTEEIVEAIKKLD